MYGTTDVSSVTRLIQPTQKAARLISDVMCQHELESITAISEFEEKRCKRELEKFLAVHCPPVHIRNEVDIGYRLENQSVEIFEIRPHWKTLGEPR